MQMQLFHNGICNIKRQRWFLAACFESTPRIIIQQAHNAHAAISCSAISPQPSVRRARSLSSWGESEKSVAVSAQSRCKRRISEKGNSCGRTQLPFLTCWLEDLGLATCPAQTIGAQPTLTENAASEIVARLNRNTTANGKQRWQHAFSAAILTGKRA